MSGWPKPDPRIKTPKPLRRGKAPARSQKRIKQTNAYSRPEVIAQAKAVRKRSKGWCEIRTHCEGDKAVGQPHHRSYDTRFTNWQRLIVPLDQLQDTCRRCHLAAEGNPQGLYA